MVHLNSIGSVVAANIMNAEQVTFCVVLKENLIIRCVKLSKIPYNHYIITPFLSSFWFLFSMSLSDLVIYATQTIGSVHRKQWS